MSVTARLIEYMVLSIVLAPFSFRYAGLDKKGSVAAFFVGLTVYISLGFRAFLLLLSLHIIGAVVTRAGFEKKVTMGIAQKKRGYENISANGIFPSLAAVFSGFFNPLGHLFFVAYVSTVAAAMADTVSSELGELSKTKPRLITTFEVVETGTDGAISFLGTTTGIGASALIAITAVFLEPRGMPLTILVIATLAGFVGMTVDSLLGASLERKGIIGNNAINVFSIGTSFAASIIMYFVLA
jgi:uncharacterized protein (TIGR00297 family)